MEPFNATIVQQRDAVQQLASKFDAVEGGYIGNGTEYKCQG